MPLRFADVYIATVVGLTVGRKDSYRTGSDKGCCAADDHLGARAGRGRGGRWRRTHSPPGRWGWARRAQYPPGRRRWLNGQRRFACVAAGAVTPLWLSEANPKADAANDTSGEDEEAATHAPLVTARLRVDVQLPLCWHSEHHSWIVYSEAWRQNLTDHSCKALVSVRGRPGKRAFGMAKLTEA